MNGDDPEFINPPDTLKTKVTVSENGVDLEALERAEGIIAGLQDNYLDWVQEDLTALDKAIADLAANRTKEDVKAELDEVFRVAHDIKGQGGSFDYPLMTVIGNQLCRYIEKNPQLQPGGVEIIKLHADALKLVIGKQMTGDGGKAGDNLVRGLEAVLSKKGG